MLLKSKFFVVIISTISILSILVTLFIIVGLLTTAKPSARITNALFTNWATEVDSILFLQLYEMENRVVFLTNDEEDPVAFSDFLLQMMTSIRLNDLKSLIGIEIPGFSTYEQHVIVATEALNDIHFLSHESGPPIEDILEIRKAVDESNISVKKTEKQQNEVTEKIVFLYSSHNRESFLPHLPEETSPDRAYHHEVNITKVNYYLANKLEQLGIGVTVDDTDITNLLHDNGWTYGRSYQASRQVVEAALTNEKNLHYVFDIHRDSLPQDKTTIEHGGQSYGTILFVIGGENKNYEKNLTLATKLHYLLNEKIPGLSRGVITKAGPNANGVYNQDLLENALLIEVGGYENHLEQLYRSMDVFANVLKNYHIDAVEVSK